MILLDLFWLVDFGPMVWVETPVFSQYADRLDVAFISQICKAGSRRPYYCNEKSRFSRLSALDTMWCEW